MTNDEAEARIKCQTNDPEEISLCRATAIIWSTDVVVFLRGAANERELDIHNAADAMRMTLRVWLAGSSFQ